MLKFERQVGHTTMITLANYYTSGYHKKRWYPFIFQHVGIEIGTAELALIIDAVALPSPSRT